MEHVTKSDMRCDIGWNLLTSWEFDGPCYNVSHENWMETESTNKLRVWWIMTQCQSQHTTGNTMYLLSGLSETCCNISCSFGGDQNAPTACESSGTCQNVSHEICRRTGCTHSLRFWWNMSQCKSWEVNKNKMCLPPDSLMEHSTMSDMSCEGENTTLTP